MRKIKVHEKALAHLSRGLYRSPASAIRELVSNAWDANAKTVRINTNYPQFLQLSIEDDGDGFSEAEFDALMAGGIGNSQKRPTGLTLINNRPVIGRLGIGMLGIAQICGSFTVTSVPKSGKAFRARVHLYDLLKQDLDSKESAHIQEDEAGSKTVDVGRYEFEEFDRGALSRGTRIVADDLHPTFSRTFRESIDERRFERFKEPPTEWYRALKVLAGVNSLQELGDYWRLLWELAAACPVPYVNQDALPSGLARKDHKRLTSYDFRLVVDGIELRKPVQLGGSDQEYSPWPIEPVRERVYGKDLAFHGYILVQEGKQLTPDELRGIMIRVKDIGIGYYDASLLDYRYNEGPRSRWVTGEIFVDAGLEDALNIDRDSFNRFDPHFRKIQIFVHELLRGRVFPTSYKEITKRSSAKRELKVSQRTRHLETIVATRAKVPVRVRHVSAPPMERPADVSVATKAGVLQVKVPSDLKTKKTNQQLAASVLAIFEIALSERDRKAQRDTFTRLLLGLLDKW